MYGVRITKGIKRVKIDVYLRNSVKAYLVVGGNVYPNRLLRNFYALLWGILTDTNVSMKDTGGSWRTARTAGDISCGGVYLCTCADTSELSFSAHNCSRNSCHDVGAIVVTDRCVEYACAVERGGKSVMPFFRMYDTGGYCRHFAMAHKLVDVADGQTVKHRICFADPWLRNMAAVIAAIACDCNDMTATDIAGNTYNLKGKYEVAAGAAEIVVDVAGTLLRTRMYRYASITDEYAYLHFTGLIVPTESVTADNIWFIGKFYDTGGNARETPVIKIASNVSLEKGKLYSLAVHIIGG